MKPGDRVALIEDCADLLLTKPLPRLQMILQQFGIETQPMDDGLLTQGDVHSYLLERLGTANGDTLTDLHDHLGNQDRLQRNNEAKGPWRDDLPARVFISHHHQRRHFAHAIKQVLADRCGIDAFVAHEDISPSKPWREVIKKALNTCHALAAILDPEFHASEWCDQEVGWALGRNLPIIPVHDLAVDRSTLGRGGFLDEHQDVKVNSLWEGGPNMFDAADGIFRVVLEDPRTRMTVGIDALVEAFVHSSSYDSTRRLWVLLEAVPQFEAEQMRRLEYAVESNRQVYETVVLRADGSRSEVPVLLKELARRVKWQQL